MNKRHASGRGACVMAGSMGQHMADDTQGEAGDRA